jgi:hypothetical protein
MPTAFFESNDPVMLLLILIGIIFSPLLIFVLLHLIFFFYKKFFYSSLSPKMVQMFVKIAGSDETPFKNLENFFSGVHGIKQDFFTRLFSVQNRFSFEVVGKKEGIFFYIVAPEKYASNIEKQVYGTYKECEIEYVPLSHPFDRGTYNLAYELKQENNLFTPIKLFEDKQEPLTNILSTFSKLGENEVMMYQLIITPASNAWISSVKKILTAKSGDKDSPSPTLDPGHKEGLEKKILTPGFYSTIRILSISDDGFRAQVNLDNTLSAFNQFNDPKNNNLVKRILTTNSAVIKRIVLRELNTFDLHLPLIHLKFYCNNMLLNCAELSNLFHFGNKLIPVPGIKKISFKKSAAPGNILSEGVVMGVNKFRDISSVIRIGDEDRLRHTYILGQTGTGKSVFLFSQALQDIYRGEGVCILDPHGKDIDEMLAKIPKHREKDVIYFKASDVERPFGFNVLEADNDYQRNTIINYFIELLNKMYDPNNQGITGPQFQQAVRSSMATCMVDPEATLIDVVELIRDPEKAEKYLPKVTDPDVISYWRNQIANTTAQTRSETLGYFTSKFTKFTSDTFMRNIIAQPKSSINIPKIMDEKKILLINLDKGDPKIGEENAKFLGLLLVPQVMYAALARTEKINKGEQFPPFYLYVDEFQNFATESFATILSEARKFKLGLTVANQFIAQLPDNIKNAVFGNVGSSVFFRVGADDASYCFKVFGGEKDSPFSEGDFGYLEKGNCYVKLLVNGMPTKPFYMKVDLDLVMPFKDDPEAAKRIKEYSRMTYGKAREEVTEIINKRFTEFYATPEKQPTGSGKLPNFPASTGSAKKLSDDFDDDFFGDL